MSEVTESSNLRPAAFMLLAVVLFSIWPALLDKELADNNPMLFNFALSTGRVVGVVLFLYIFFRSTLTDPRAQRLIYRAIASWVSGKRTADVPPAPPQIRVYLILGVAAHFSHALFAFSTHFTDTAIATIVHELQPLLTMFLLQRIFAEPGGSARYRRITGGVVFLLLFALAGLAFVVIGSTTRGDGPVPTSASAGGVGVALALVSALLGACNAYSMRWGSELHQVVGDQSSLAGRHSTELAFMMLAYGLSSLIAAPVSLIVGLGSGAALNSSLVTPALAGCFLFVAAHVFQRRAFIETTDLAISALNYATPLFALFWLALFTEIIVPHPNLVLIGAVLIVAVNSLLNLNPEETVDIGRPRLGFRSLILALMFFGTVVYFRDTYLPDDLVLWSWGEYWGLIALAATIFTVMLSFQTTRLVDRTISEENRTISLFRSLELLCREGVLSPTILDKVHAIDRGSQSDSLRTPYLAARGELTSTLKSGEPSSDQRGRLVEAEANLDMLVLSKQYGREFGELIAIVLFGLSTILVTVLTRPDLQPWSAFLSDLFVVLFASTITFLMLNILDMRRERSRNTLVRSAASGPTVYEVHVASISDLAKQRTISLIVGLAVIAAFAYLMWDKWF